MNHFYENRDLPFGFNSYNHTLKCSGIEAMNKPDIYQGILSTQSYQHLNKSTIEGKSTIDHLLQGSVIQTHSFASTSYYISNN